MVVNIVDTMDRKGLTAKVTFEENEGRTREESGGRSFSVRGKGKCKGPEAGAYPICWAHSKEISVEEQSKRGGRRT